MRPHTTALILCLAVLVLALACQATQLGKKKPEADSVTLKTSPSRIVKEAKQLWHMHAEKHKLFRRISRSTRRERSRKKKRRRRWKKRLWRMRKHQQHPRQIAGFQALVAQLSALKTLSTHLTPRDSATVSHTMGKTKHAMKLWVRTLSGKRLSLTQYQSISDAIALRVKQLGKLLKWAAKRKTSKATLAYHAKQLHVKRLSVARKLRQARLHAERERQKQRLIDRRNRQRARDRRRRLRKARRKARRQRRAARKAMLQRTLKARRRKYARLRALKARRRRRRKARRARLSKRQARRRARAQRRRRRRAIWRRAIQARRNALKRLKRARAIYQSKAKKVPRSFRPSNAMLTKLRREIFRAKVLYKRSQQHIHRLIAQKRRRAKRRERKRLKRLKLRMERLRREKNRRARQKKRKVKLAMARVRKKLQRAQHRDRLRKALQKLKIHKRKALRKKKASIRHHLQRKSKRHQLKRKWVAVRKKKSALVQKALTLALQKKKAKGKALKKLKKKMRKVKRQLKIVKRKEESKAFKYWERVYADTVRRITKTQVLIKTAKPARKVMLQHELEALRTLKKMSHRACLAFISSDGLARYKTAAALAVRKAYLKSLNKKIVRKNKVKVYRSCKGQGFARGVCRIHMDDRTSSYFRRSKNNSNLGVRRDKMLPEVEAEWKFYENSCSNAKEQVHVMSTQYTGLKDAPLPAVTALGYEEGDSSFYFGIVFKGNYKKRTSKHATGVEFWKNGHKVKKDLWKTKFTAGNMHWVPDTSEDWMYSIWVTNPVTKTKLHIKLYGIGADRTLDITPHMSVSVYGNKNGHIGGLCADNTFMAPVQPAFSMFPAAWRKGRKPLSLQAALLDAVKTRHDRYRQRILKDPTDEARKLLKIAKATMLTTKAALVAVQKKHAPFAAAIKKAKSLVTTAKAKVAQLAKDKKSTVQAKKAAASALASAQTALKAAIKSAIPTSKALKSAKLDYGAAEPSLDNAKGILAEALKADKQLKRFKKSLTVKHVRAQQKKCKDARKLYRRVVLDGNKKRMQKACKAFHKARQKIDKKLGVGCRRWRLHDKRPACLVHRWFSKNFMPRWQYLRFRRSNCLHARKKYFKTKNTMDKARAGALCKSFEIYRNRERHLLHEKCPVGYAGRKKLRKGCKDFKAFDKVFARRFVGEDIKWHYLTALQVKCRLARTLSASLAAQKTSKTHTTFRKRVLAKAKKAAARNMAARICRRFKRRRRKKRRALLKWCHMTTSKSWRVGTTRACRVHRYFIRKYNIRVRSAKQRKLRRQVRKSRRRLRKKSRVNRRARISVKKKLVKMVNKLKQQRRHSKKATKVKKIKKKKKKKKKKKGRKT